MTRELRNGLALAGVALHRSAVFFIASALLFLPGLALGETRSFDLSGFDGISASEGIHVLVDVGDEFSVTAESDERAQLARLVLDVRRGTLRARMDNRPFSFRRTKGWKVTVRVTMPELIDANSSSGAELVIDEMTGDDLDLNASSGAELRVTSLTGESVDASASSGARIDVAGGTCDELEADASSGSSVKMKAVECKTVEVNASSGSNAEVFADESIDANASSGGAIKVHGAHEKIEINSSSGGTIRFP